MTKSDKNDNVAGITGRQKREGFSSSQALNLNQFPALEKVRPRERSLVKADENLNPFFSAV